jgi:DNA-binding NarL/FixJ family response regulator
VTPGASKPAEDVASVLVEAAESARRRGGYAAPASALEQAQALPARALREPTPQELQLAFIVGRVARNKEAAAALFISPKTVEAHLHRIYVKLGNRSRTELAGLVVRAQIGE